MYPLVVRLSNHEPRSSFESLRMSGSATGN